MATHMAANQIRAQLWRAWRLVTEQPLCVFTVLALCGYKITAFVMLLCYCAANRHIETQPSPLRTKPHHHGRDQGHEAIRNAPCPVGFVVNSRGRRLYYRILTRSDQPPTCLVVLLHGYAAHFNRPTYLAFASALLEQGIAVASLDLEGHGCFLPIQPHATCMYEGVGVVRAIDLEGHGSVSAKGLPLSE